MEKVKKNNKGVVVKEWVLATVGVLILAIATRAFLEPNHIAGGGVLGIAIVLHHYIPISVGLLTALMNIILFIIAFIVIGPQFGAKTIYSSFALAGSIWIMDRLIDPAWVVTDNLLLATIFGTLLSGVGMGLVFNQNASTGGTDILAKIMNKFIHIDLGKALLMVDFLVTVAAGVTFNAEVGMYSLLSVIINCTTIDSVINGLNMCKSVMVISMERDKISKFIINELGRGCTIFHGKGGFSGQDTNILYTVLDRKQFIRLKIFIKEVDPRAFITVSDAREVLGEGFKDIIED
ncbi:YitT family protein [Haloimpatiens lingqiaonensis]|uniref:YitT family protein n=1 Tax=Haloimpatiens lingqiaonensis TaxID=1380675 RepID=UPI0010FEED3E|nr:YitT family protein [Haloimpatiens lingqiaonensis]